MKNKETCIILAAGASSRMGCNKMLLPWNNKTILSSVICTVKNAGLLPLVVLGYCADAILHEISQYVDDSKSSIVIHENWQHGMITSIQAGMLHGGENSYWLLHGDMPCLTSNMLETIIASMKNIEREKYDVVFPQYHNQHGHPVWVNRSIYNDILRLPQGERFRPFLETKKSIGVEVPFQAITMDIDTRETYDHYCKLYGSS